MAVTPRPATSRPTSPLTSTGCCAASRSRPCTRRRVQYDGIYQGFRGRSHVPAKPCTRVRFPASPPVDLPGLSRSRGVSGRRESILPPAGKIYTTVCWTRRGNWKRFRVIRTCCKSTTLAAGARTRCSSPPTSVRMVRWTAWFSIRQRRVGTSRSRAAGSRICTNTDCSISTFNRPTPCCRRTTCPCSPTSGSPSGPTRLGSTSGTGRTRRRSLSSLRRRRSRPTSTRWA